MQSGLFVCWSNGWSPVLFFFTCRFLSFFFKEVEEQVDRYALTKKNCPILIAFNFGNKEKKRTKDKYTEEEEEKHTERKRDRLMVVGEEFDVRDMTAAVVARPRPPSDIFVQNFVFSSFLSFSYRSCLINRPVVLLLLLPLVVVATTSNQPTTNDANSSYSTIPWQGPFFFVLSCVSFLSPVTN